MIADLSFDRADSTGVRRVRFVPRASIPLGAACLVANGIRETLRELFGQACELSIGEPVTIGEGAWAALAHESYCFLTRGRQTDIVLVIPAADARAIVQRAFGEGEVIGSLALSTLEVHALERIASRCAAAFDPLYAERRSPSHLVTAAGLPACVAFFDVRLTAPINAAIGIGIVRDLPDPGPSGAFAPKLLATVPVDVRVEFAAGSIDAGTFLHLAPGDVVPLQTQVGAPASLKIADRYIASGTGGIAGGHYSFEVHALHATGAHS